MAPGRRLPACHNHGAGTRRHFPSVRSPGVGTGPPTVRASAPSVADPTRDGRGPPFSRGFGVTTRTLQPAAYAGDRGFTNISTSRLSDTLRRYRKLRDEATDPAVRAYARSVIIEIRAEFARRDGKRQAVAA